jgi:hypothetical protein
VWETPRRAPYPVLESVGNHRGDDNRLKFGDQLTGLPTSGDLSIRQYASSTV